jgi:ketosteroid isomerase-like protein
MRLGRPVGRRADDPSGVEDLGVGFSPLDRGGGEVAHPNEELARGATDALNRGDAQAFLDMHADDVAVHITGRNALSGDLKGKGELGASFQKQLEMFDAPPDFEIHDVLANDEHVVILGTQRAARGGRTLESKATVVAHIRDGKFTELWVTSIDPYAEDEFLA